MIFPDFSQFSQLASQGNFIPVYQEWVADLDTPVYSGISGMGSRSRYASIGLV